MSGYTVVATYPHPIDRVWQALVDPEVVPRWTSVGRGAQPVGFSPRAGARFQWVGRPTVGWNGVVDCEVLEARPPQVLRYSWKGGAGDETTTVTCRLESLGSHTELSFDHRGFTGAFGWVMSRLLASVRRKMLGALRQVLDEQAGQSATRGAAKTMSERFDAAYRLPLTLWGDLRVPREVVELSATGAPKTALDLGCGVGRVARALSLRGVAVTAVDFSPVAIAKARRRVARDAQRPRLLVGDVTRLDGVEGPFDFSYDVGCFHCLEPAQQPRYATEVARLLKPGATHLLWAMDSAPNGQTLTEEAVSAAFEGRLRLTRSKPSRRRLVASHWYWLSR